MNIFFKLLWGTDQGYEKLTFEDVQKFSFELGSAGGPEGFVRYDQVFPLKVTHFRFGFD